jgi:signal transduction histidine kinase/ActR/RegA family two-component response regulator
MVRFPSMAGPVRTFSLRTYLLFLVIATAIPVMLVGAVLVSRVVRDNRVETERRLLEAARVGASVVDAELQGTIRALQGLAESDRLVDSQLAEFRLQAERVMTTQPIWAAVSLAGLDRRQIVNTRQPVGDRLPEVTDLDSFDRAVQTRAPAIGTLHVGKMTQERGFLVRVPVLRDGSVRYVLSAWITSKGFSSVLGRQAPFPDEWVRGVVDTNGVVVARSRDSERYVGQKGTAAFLARYGKTPDGVYRDIALDGTLVYGAYSQAPASRWIAGVGVPVSIVDAAFKQSMVALAATTLLLLSIGGGGTYLLSRQISRDISHAAEDADAISLGLAPSPVSSDITELRRLQDGLVRSYALIETRQRERDEQVARADAARAEAEAADRAKDEFLALLGHELRNPLAPALTAVHLLKQRGENGREREIIERQIRHMARLVDDLLDVSRLRRGAIELRREPFDLAEAVSRAVEMTSPIFTDKHHELVVEVPQGLIVDGDRIRIAQVISNLLSNAAKYTEPHGRIVVDARQEYGEVVLECRDNGSGITPELMPRVFDLFVQGERGLDRRQGGLGLGLAVARMLVERHGGTIEVASAGPKQGSTFVVRLPAAASSAMPPGVDLPVAAASTARTGRVLVVDDNHDALVMLLDAFKHADIEAVGAATAKQAMDLATEIRPDVAVLDIGLPDINGFELARSLRALPGGAWMRLIAVTGYGREQDKAAARAAGFDAFFAKPVDMPTLLHAMERVVCDTRQA